MEIKNIRTFLRVAELGSFTRAAQELGYAQSTITTQVQQLESELRCNLFDRNGKKVTLSATGREFMQYAYQILKYESMTLEHFSSSGQPEGVLNIGIMETICASEYASIFQSFQQKHPKVSLNLQIVTPYQALDLLDKGIFDLIFLLDNKISSPNRVTAREYPVEIYFFASSTHPLAKEQEVSLDRLLQERFILTEKGCTYRQVFESELAARGKYLNCHAEIGYSPYIIQAVTAQQAIGLLPSITLEDPLKKGLISRINVKKYQIHMSIQVIYSNKRRISLPLKAFLEEL